MTSSEIATEAIRLGAFQHHDEFAAFIDYVVSIQPHNVCEIGTLHGGTAYAWHSICTGTVFSIDLPQGRFGGADHGYTWEKAHDRNEMLKTRMPRFLGLLGDSKKMVESLKFELGSHKLDMLFIDGDHTLMGVMSDFVLYAPLVRKGGIIAFHDVLDTPLHRKDGVDVPAFFELLGACAPWHQEWKTFTNASAPWGGIGLVRA